MSACTVNDIDHEIPYIYSVLGMCKCNMQQLRVFSWIATIVNTDNDIKWTHTGLVMLTL